MMKKGIKYILLSIIMSLTAYSCQDDFYVPGTEEIGEGMCDVSLQIAYQPNQTSETRSAGTALDAHFYTPLVFFFDSDGNVVSKFKLASGDLTNKQSKPVDNSNYAEDTYKYAEIPHGKIQVPFGRYRIYVVLEGGAVPFNSITTLADLRNVNVAWSSDNASNAISFGSCSSTDRAINVADDENDYYVDASGTAHDAHDGELITLNQPKQSVSAWTKRLASKVSVSYDASGLNSGIKIYIKSVQIKDIPKTCYLGRCNTPTSADQLQAGELIDYKPGVTDFTGWDYICSDESGKATFGSSHAQNDGTKNYMYFFENNQGIGENRHHTPATGWEQSNYEKYDNKLGTYIEVKGYYVDSNIRNPNQGPITYRFMLGQNTTTDYNAKRSKHYKITLGFNKDADNPDWHIEYADIPDALMLSYGAELKSNLRLKLVCEPTDKVTVDVTTLYSHWYYDGHPYAYLGAPGAKYGDNKWGFFTLEDPATNTNFVGTKSYVSNGDGTQSGAIREIDIPVWTRQMMFQREDRPTDPSSIGGYNIFFDHQRYGKIHAVIKVNGAVRYEKDISIVQVNRIENPSGIWRSSSSDAPFHVQLSRRDGDATNFTVIQSYLGPWSAKVIGSDSSWALISPNGSDNWGSTVTGDEGTDIQFWYKPNGTIASTESRYAIIEVRYHSNNCIHYIFCRQGYAPTQFNGQSFKWCTGNQLAKDVEATTPTQEGSMFKFGNEDDAILASNNLRDGFGFYKPGGSTANDYAFCATYTLNTAWPSITDAPHESTARKGYMSQFKSETPLTVDKYEFVVNGGVEQPKFDIYGGTQKTWAGIPWSRTKADAHFPTMKVATEAQWKTLSSLTRDYGVLYGDESTDTQLDITNAFQYINPGQAMGMRGCFVFDPVTAKQLFFPIGATGFGRRIAFDHNNRLTSYTATTAYDVPWYTWAAHLKYAQRAIEMPKATAEILPLYYDIYRQNGAVYWYRARVEDPNLADNEQTIQNGTVGWDINYTTLGFDKMSGGNVMGTYLNQVNKSAWSTVRIWNTASIFASDACYVRCVIE